MANDQALDGAVVAAPKVNDFTKGTTAPSSPVLGNIWADTNFTPAKLKVYNGSGWDVAFILSGDATALSGWQSAVGSFANYSDTLFIRTGSNPAVYVANSTTAPKTIPLAQRSQVGWNTATVTVSTSNVAVDGVTYTLEAGITYRIKLRQRVSAGTGVSKSDIYLFFSRQSGTGTMTLIGTGGSAGWSRMESTTAIISIGTPVLFSTTQLDFNTAIGSATAGVTASSFEAECFVTVSATSTWKMLASEVNARASDPSILFSSLEILPTGF